MEAPAAQHYIPIFIDVKPSEDLRPLTGQTMCFVGMLANSMEGIAGLKQFKKTRTIKRKLKAANRIVEALSDGSLALDGIAVTGKMNGHFAHWACDAVDRNRNELEGEWQLEDGKPTHLLWNGHSYPRDTALGLSIYANMLPIIGLQSARLCKNEYPKHMKLALDQLPHCSERGTSFMDALLGSDKDIQSMWDRNRKWGHTFELGVFESYRAQDANTITAKEHPNSVLVDWLAASCMAKVDPEQLKAESGFTDDQVAIIAEIWDALNHHGSSEMINVDDAELAKMVTAHAAKHYDSSLDTASENSELVNQTPEARGETSK
ncbi:MAG: hypothetical protein HKN27_15320 [Silicimonas sp.]|nr:hypothetical protein [Silicimonas sp.]